MVSLEDFVKAPEFPALRRRIFDFLAASLGRMHSAGLNHRDCYICHYLADKNTLENDPAVYVIDLHRARQRKKVPYHYHIKDTAGLFFSSMDAGLTRRDFYRFMKLYSHKSLREILQKDMKFYNAVDITARKLYKKDHKKAAPEF